MSPRKPYTNSSLEKGLMVLAAIAKAPRPMGVSETARHVDLDYSTTYRLISTLAHLDYLERVPDTKRYRIGPATLPLGLAYQTSSELTAAAVPEMRRLVQQVDETVNLSIRDGDGMLLLASCPGPHLLATRTRVGHRFPIHCSASGRVALAGMTEAERDALIDKLELTPETPHTITDRDRLRAEVRAIAERGYAINREEHALGLTAVGVPLRNAAGDTIAALDTAIPTVRVADEGYLEELSNLLTRSARLIAHRIAPD